MSDAVLVALISAVGLIMSGVLVELVRTRRRAGAAAEHAEVAAHQTQKNSGSSMRDVIDRIDRRQAVANERASRTEGKVDRLTDAFDRHLAEAAERDRLIEAIRLRLDLPPSD